MKSPPTCANHVVSQSQTLARGESGPREYKPCRCTNVPQIIVICGRSVSPYDHRMYCFLATNFHLLTSAVVSLVQVSTSGDGVISVIFPAKIKSHVHLQGPHNFSAIRKRRVMKRLCLHKGMEEFLKRELATSKLRSLGGSSGGCISNGESYETDSGRVFVKYNTDPKVKINPLTEKGAWSVICGLIFVTGKVDV